MNELDMLRLKINEVDEALAHLFEERMNIVEKISCYKKQNNLPVLNQNRENDMKQNNIKYIKNSKIVPYYIEFLEMCLKTSKDYQKQI